MIATQANENQEETIFNMSKFIKEIDSKFVCFRLEKQVYALPVDRVERALRMVAVKQVPESPDWLKKKLIALDLKKTSLEQN